MVTRKSRSEIDRMRQAGAIVAEVLDLVEGELKPGISTAHLDRLAERHIRKAGAVPSFLDYPGVNPRRPFPGSICVSIDDEIVHGIPSRKRVLREGSIVSVDCGVHLEGFHADSATTIPVGTVGAEAERLMAVTQEALAAGIAAAQAGHHVGDVGHAVQTVAEAAGFGVVRELVGHGIGTRFHEEPQVPNHGQPHRGAQLKPGMTIAIEPMITAGSYETRTLPDKWTVVTVDGSLSAHFEHTVAITLEGPRVLTM